MKEIVTDWGIDMAHFQSLYKKVETLYGEGVTLKDNWIHFDNNFAKGEVGFFPLNNRLSIMKLDVLFSEAVNFKRKTIENPDYYACLFSLKEGVDLHAFDIIEEQEWNRFGLHARHSVLYFSSDVHTLFRVTPNERIKVLIVVFTSDALSDFLPVKHQNSVSQLFQGSTVKGYASMSAGMIDVVTDILQNDMLNDYQTLYLAGASHMILSMLMQQIEKESERLEQSTGIHKVARIIQIRNLLVNDFSKENPRIEELARKAQMSVARFKMVFKELFKLPCYQYYQRHRLLAAKQELTLGKSVTETAYEFGFNSTSNFCVAFKKMFNISPREIAKTKGKIDSAL
ncbi:helix-turn-helix transcriptional regulator [Pinibacter aurantiacus]|uniref:AraC family transcriptional regulator n=1 Tax=Pinibacter aurantiacus TaxID=2851599 RepID=A0A9E2S7T3_9BACT|nr:AraC family transcriptional regulator [Pinibacter aurantiacus]MBV4357461.1 AraC family transcriptional regulator [Pinibacter aurantiacus]